MALLVHRNTLFDLPQRFLLALFMKFIKFGGKKLFLIEAVKHLSYLYVPLLVGFEIGLLWIDYLIRSKILCKAEVFLRVFIGYRQSFGLRTILAVFIAIALAVSATSSRCSHPSSLLQYGQLMAVS